MAKPPSVSRGEGNIAQDKKFEPSGLATYVLALPSSEHVKGEGYEEPKKSCRASLRNKLKLSKYFIKTGT
jgi:hypothetical protein